MSETARDKAAAEPGSEGDNDPSRAPLLEHLVELRRRLIYSVIALVLLFFVCYAFAEPIFQFLVRPLSQAFEDETGRRMIYTGLAETFFTYIKVAFFAALFLAFPIIANQFWKFVAPGLYANERRALMPYLIATPIMFFLGGAMVYYVVFPLAWEFFLSFESGAVEGALPIQLEARVSEYLSLVMALIFAFGIFFEIPVALTLMARAGLVTAAGLSKYRRHAIVAMFIAAAVLTPPDVISQLGLALPGILLYEISLLLVRLIERKRLRREAAEAAEVAE